MSASSQAETTGSVDRSLIDKAIELARALQERAIELQTPQERRQQAELDRMMQSPGDKITLVRLTDQAFRSSRAWRSVDQLTHVLDVQGIPRFFSPLDRTLLRGFQSFGGYLPGVAVPLVKEKMHHETANVVLPAEPDELGNHLRARREERVRMNVNFLGEALLGECEAERRLNAYLHALQSADIEVISVKISTLYSQIAPLAHERTLERLCDRLELLYRAAAKARFVHADGHETAKLVYLDMEEYRDLRITVEAFRHTLDRDGLESASAGIALQAYVPDSFTLQRELTEWAIRRVAAGGAPIVLRVVKGANMEMERVEASLQGWPQAPFKTKRETDANYKRMLAYALVPERAAAVRVGVASHNLFDVAFGLELAASRGVLDHVQFEMLEGMANHQRRALFERTDDMLLYAPACRREEFLYAVGYLLRRLDENTGPDNFLRHAFRLSVDSEEWRALEADFRRSFESIAALPDGPRRGQDRRREPTPPMEPSRSWRQFTNEPDTDFSLPHNVEWAEAIRKRWSEWCGTDAIEVPLVVAGQELHADRAVVEAIDPSRPASVVGRYRVATSDDVERAVACARKDPQEWRAKSAAERGVVLREVAQQIRRSRGDLMGVALAEGGKTLEESDPEVSEAVDFCELYARAAEDIAGYASLDASGLGVVAVVPPWNFPISIPCGGVAAALAAGNTVILKPAPEAVCSAYMLCRCFWAAGISRETLQLVYAEDAAGATQLVTHAGVDAVVLTGGTDTALHLLELEPTMRLLAESGGKNAIIVTAMSDRELAIKHVVHSAFGHSGQKCSAASLLVLEDEVYEDESFRALLCDAVGSLAVGSAWDPATKVGPLIRPPAGKLERGLKELEPGESWAVRPRAVEGNPHCWSPGIKWGVRPGSTTHMTELFGPVLGVMRARNLDEAIDLVNATGYGLTSGLHSLDDREQEIWLDSVRAGNLYVNRGITGAVALRQPFGGVGKSAFGPGIKAGGPNYVVPLMRLRDAARPSGTDHIADENVARLLDDLADRDDVYSNDRTQLGRAVASYSLQVREEFGCRHDHFRLVGQDNFRRYRPVGHLRVRVSAEDSLFQVLARACAAKIAGCQITVSFPAEDASVELLQDLTESWAGAIEFVEESDEELARVIRTGQTDRIRYAGQERVPPEVRRAAAESGRYVAAVPVLMEGRVEMLWYLWEQSISIDYHRYGNLGGRPLAGLAEPL